MESKSYFALSMGLHGIGSDPVTKTIAELDIWPRRYLVQVCGSRLGDG